MNKELVSKAILSAINLISSELDSITYDELRFEFEQTLEQLNIALKEIKEM